MHRLQTALHDALEKDVDFCDVVEACEIIVSGIRRHGPASACFRQAQLDNGVNINQVKELVTNCKTRWEAEFHMISTISALGAYVKTTIEKFPIYFTLR